MPGNADISPVRRQITGDHLHGGGFAGAVGTEESQHLALPDSQVEAGDSGHGAEALYQSCDFNHGWRKGRSSGAGVLREIARPSQGGKTLLLGDRGRPHSSKAVTVLSSAAAK